ALIWPCRALMASSTRPTARRTGALSSAPAPAGKAATKAIHRTENTRDISVNDPDRRAVVQWFGVHRRDRHLRVLRDPRNHFDLGQIGNRSLHVLAAQNVFHDLINVGHGIVLAQR